MQHNYLTIGRNLKDLRMGSGLSQSQFCYFLKVNQSQYSKLERGKQGLKPDQIMTLCNLFKVTPNYFFSDTKNNNPKN